MNVLKSSCIFLLLCQFIYSPHCRAQDSTRTFIGVIGNYQFGSPTSINRTLGGIETFGSDGTGVSWDNGFGLGFYLQMPQFFSSRLGCSVRASFVLGSGQFKSNNFVISNSSISQSQVEDFRVLTQYNKVEGEFLTTYNLSQAFFAGVGVFGNYRTKTTTVEQNEIISPLTAFFANKQKIDTIPSGSNINTSKFHFGIPFLVGARFQLSRLLSLNIESFSQIDLGEIIAGFPKQSVNIGLRLAVSINTNPPSLPSHNLDLPSHMPSLTTVVNFTTNDKPIRQLVAQTVDTIFRRYLMLPSIIYYEEGKMELPTMLHASKNDTSLHLASLNSTDPHESYDNVLNIIGQRMKDLPNSELTLTSYRLAQESEQLAKVRVNQLAEFFKKIWGILGIRINVRTDKSDKRKPFVELSDNSKLLSPFINEWEERSLLIPPISLSRFISSEAGVKSWSLNVTDGIKLVAHFSNDDTLAAGEPLGILTLHTGNNINTQIVGRLQVLDNSGQSKEVFDTMTITGSFSNSASSTVTKEIFILLSDTSKNSRMWNEALLEKASSTISSSTTVRFQPLYQTGSAISIDNYAGDFIRSLKLGNQFAHHMQIIPDPLLSNGTVQRWEILRDAMVVTITNVH